MNAVSHYISKSGANHYVYLYVISTVYITEHIKCACYCFCCYDNTTAWMFALKSWHFWLNMRENSKQTSEWANLPHNTGQLEWQDTLAEYTRYSICCCFCFVAFSRLFNNSCTPAAPKLHTFVCPVLSVATFVGALTSSTNVWVCVFVFYSAYTYIYIYYLYIYIYIAIYLRILVVLCLLSLVACRSLMLTVSRKTRKLLHDGVATRVELA